MDDLIERAYRLSRTILDATSDEQAHDALLSLVIELVHASRAHIFTLSPNGDPVLARTSAREPLSRAELATCHELVTAALERHQKKQALAASTAEVPGTPDTNESFPLSVVAKVIADTAMPLAVAVAVRKERTFFSEEERRHFTTLCLNATSGLARRRLRQAPIPAPAPSETEGQLKTRRLKVDETYFQKALGGLLGESKAIVELRQRLYRFAQSDHSVLLLGESGTGKELAARLIHEESARRKGPFRAVNCGAIAEGIAESELFGHVKGAFTGAVADAAGMFVAASGGTLFLDELGDLPPEMQVKLLRVLETGEVTPLGSTKPVRVDVRTVAATNADLEKRVEERTFRRDLYYRIATLRVLLRPLRERGDDVLLLARTFLEKEMPEDAQLAFSDAALRAIQRAPWPGNVRQLKKAVALAVVVAKSRYIEPEDLALSPDGATLPEEASLEAPADASDAAGVPRMDDTMRQAIVSALKLTGGNKTQAAKHLGMHRNRLSNLIAKLGIDADAIG